MSNYCPRCKKTSDAIFVAKDYNRRVSGHQFEYFRCLSCNLIFLSPIPLNLEDYYSSSYHTVPASQEALERMSMHDSYKVEIIQKFKSSGRLLEIGSSYGGFAFRAKRAGFEVEALEMNEECCRFLTDELGIQAIRSDDATVGLANRGPYDVIALWHVIEHLRDPWSMLNAIADKLNHEGLLVIAAPNPDSFQFKVLGRFWPHLDAPRHLELIPPALLEAHLRHLGLAPQWSTTTDSGTLGWNVFGWEHFFGNFSKTRFINRRLRKIGRIVSRMFGPFERRRNRGSAYTVVFRKEKHQ